MGDLKPLDDSLPTAQLALAADLRVLFAGLDIKPIRYAARIHVHKSVLSRYLSGRTIPPWTFVHQLFVEVAHARGDEAAQVEVVAALKALHQAALAASSTPAHRILLLEEALAEADRVAQRAARRERELEQELEDAQMRVSALAVEGREAEAREYEATDRYATAVARYEDTAAAHREDRRALLEEIARLQDELEQAHQRRLEAEQRCHDLEQQLESGPVAEDTTENHDNWVAALGAPSGELPHTPAVSVIAARAALEHGALEVAVERLLDSPPDEAAHLIGTFHPRETVAELLASFLPAEAGPLLNRLTARAASSCLDLMNPLDAAALLDAMEYKCAAAVAAQLPRDWTGHALREVRRLPLGQTHRAVSALNWADPGAVADAISSSQVPEARFYLESMHPARAVHVLTLLAAPRAAECLVSLNQRLVASALEAMPSIRAGEVLTHMYVGEASEVVEVLQTRHAAEILQAVETQTAAAILGLSQTANAHAVLKEISEERARDIVDAMPAERRELLNPTWLRPWR